MRTRLGIPTSRFWMGLVLVSVLGCTDTVVRDREPFNPPPDANNKFLGFFTASDKQTTCGNCHVLHQRDWAGTAHSNAYSLLAGNSNATDACFTCHTVSDKGNAVAAPAGWDVVHDTAYYDVQCENCHGPGLDHVMNPDAPKSASNPPLAHIGLLGPSGAPDSAAQGNSCGACHNQNSGPGVRAFEEWEQSGHARPVLEPGGASPADNPSCASCHEGKAILAAWGVTANYAEKGQTGSENNLGQTCAVCHDPHGTAKDPNTGEPLPHQLRYPLNTPDVNQQLCMKCHQRRSVPDVASSRGPHSPQGPMLLGDAGYQPQGFEPDLQAVASTHGSERNPELCAGCHVNRLEGTDVATGKPAVSAGHLFLAIPCLDAGGLPVKTDCPDDVPSRSWAACTASGCHASATVAAQLFTGISQDLDRLTKEIWDDKNGNDAIDPDSTACAAGARRIRVSPGPPPVTDTIGCNNPDPGGDLAREAENRANWDGGILARTDVIPIIGPLTPTDPDTNQYAINDNKITPAEGARFNVRMLRPEGGADGSHGVHNPFLARALLGADIDELHVEFPTLPAVSRPVQAIMQRSLSTMYSRPLSRR